MRIVVLSDDAVSNMPGGIGITSRGVIVNLARINKYEIILFFANTRNLDLSWVPQNVHTKQSVFSRKLLYKFIFPILKIDLSFFVKFDRMIDPLSQSYVPSEKKSYHIIHDFFPEEFKGKFSLSARAYRSHNFQKLKNKNKIIITPSDFTANRAIKHGFKLKNIFIIKWGFHINSSFDIKKIRQNIIDLKNEKSFLFIGRNDSRKNTERLFLAYNSLVANEKYSNILLILCGSQDFYIDNFFEEKIISKNIIQLGYINDDEKSFLLTYTNAFIYPSLVEGFGVPILECFAHNTPIICSNTSSIPEIGGDIPYYFNPNSTTELINQMIKILAPSSNSTINLMVKKGYSRLKIFTWDKYLDQLMSLLDD
jgi:glycosyltransferase involved in cell wall biosynthesis